MRWVNSGGVQRILKNLTCAELMDLVPELEDEDSGFCFFYCFLITHEDVSQAGHQSHSCFCRQGNVPVVGTGVQPWDRGERVGEEWEWVLTVEQTKTQKWLSNTQPSKHCFTDSNMFSMAQFVLAPLELGTMPFLLKFSLSYILLSPEEKNLSFFGTHFGDCSIQHHWRVLFLSLSLPLRWNSRFYWRSLRNTEFSKFFFPSGTNFP